MQAAPPPGHSPLQAPTTSTTSAKPPTQVAAGVWKARITAYESFYTPKRSFPERLLLGAEKTLARMVHEHEESKMYTLVSLGEILQTRHFNALGDVNQQATRESQKTLTLEGGEITEKKTPSWQPSSMWQVIDGLEATKWAIVFAQWGTEEEVTALFEWYIKLARQLNNAIWIFNEWWKHSFWRIAMLMRHGSSLAKAAHDVMADHADYQDFLHRRRNSTPPPKRYRQYELDRSSPPKKIRLTDNKQKGGRKGKGKGTKGDPERKPLTEKDICRNYNKGTCQNKQCNRKHICLACFSKNKRFHHPEKDCRSTGKKPGDE